jgi:branched-chain amino acid aminotransferase
MAPIPEMDTIWMNGVLVPWHEAKVHVLTHALHYGSGVFEGIRAYKTPKGPAVLRLTEHFKRLVRSAKLYYMPVPYTVEQLYDATFEVLSSNSLDAAYIRPLVFRGYGEMGLFPMNAPVDVIVAAWPWGTYLGEEGILHGVRAKVSSIQSLDHTALARAAKATGQYLNSILAKIEVLNAGYDEAVMLTEHGHVAEGSGENIFCVRNGVLMTPPPSDGVLEGITRDIIFHLAESEGIELQERSLSRSDLVIADELFYTGTAAEVVPIREVDDHLIGEPGPVTRLMQERFKAITEGRDEEFADYMEYARK